MRRDSTNYSLKPFLLHDLCIKLQQNLNPAFHEELQQVGVRHRQKFYHCSFQICLSKPSGSRRPVFSLYISQGVVGLWHRVLGIPQLIHKAFASPAPLHTQVSALCSSPCDLLASSGQGRNDNSSSRPLLPAFQFKGFRVLSQSLTSQIISTLEETQCMRLCLILGLTELYLHILTSWKEGEKYSESG